VLPAAHTKAELKVKAEGLKGGLLPASALIAPRSGKVCPFGATTEGRPEGSQAQPSSTFYRSGLATSWVGSAFGRFNQESQPGVVVFNKKLYVRATFFSPAEKKFKAVSARSVAHRRVYIIVDNRGGRDRGRAGRWREVGRVAFGDTARRAGAM
jgi:hypothetical protein